MIYLSEDVEVLLKNEENASALISDLLRKHYNYQEQSKLTAKERLELFRKHKEQNLTPILSEEEKLMKDVELEEEREKNFILEQQKRKEKEEFKKRSLFNTFKEEVGREMFEEEYNEYLERIKIEPKYNFFKFCDEKITGVKDNGEDNGS